MVAYMSFSELKFIDLFKHNLHFNYWQYHLCDFVWAHDNADADHVRFTFAVSERHPISGYKKSTIDGRGK